MSHVVSIKIVTCFPEKKPIKMSENTNFKKKGAYQNTKK